MKTKPRPGCASLLGASPSGPINDNPGRLRMKTSNGLHRLLSLPVLSVYIMRDCCIPVPRFELYNVGGFFLVYFNRRGELL